MPLALDVLLFGHDEVLERTRSELLKRAGFKVDAVGSFVQLKSCLAAKPYILLVLCHSLSRGEQAAGISLAASFLPAAHLLALEKSLAGAVDHPLAQVLHTGSGPEVFLSTVRTLVRSTDPLTRFAKRKIAMAQLEGTVTWFDNAKGYGFLGRKDGGGGDVFLHHSAIQGAGYKSRIEGEAITFDGVEGEKGSQADQGQPLKQK